VTDALTATGCYTDRESVGWYSFGSRRLGLRDQKPGRSKGVRTSSN